MLVELSQQKQLPLPGYQKTGLRLLNDGVGVGTTDAEGAYTCKATGLSQNQVWSSTDMKTCPSSTKPSWLGKSLYHVSFSSYFRRLDSNCLKIVKSRECPVPSFEFLWSSFPNLAYAPAFADVLDFHAHTCQFSDNNASSKNEGNSLKENLPFIALQKRASPTLQVAFLERNSLSLTKR